VDCGFEGPRWKHILFETSAPTRFWTGLTPFPFSLTRAKPGNYTSIYRLKMATLHLFCVLPMHLRAVKIAPINSRKKISSPLYVHTQKLQKMYIVCENGSSQSLFVDSVSVLKMKCVWSLLFQLQMLQLGVARGRKTFKQVLQYSMHILQSSAFHPSLWVVSKFLFVSLSLSFLFSSLSSPLSSTLARSLSLSSLLQFVKVFHLHTNVDFILHLLALIS
jgi:hypothetical protein